jgi:hypothetical protein
MNNDFSTQINQLLANNNQQSDFRPVRIGAKKHFVGRILPLEQGQFPFAQYQQAWVNYTTKSGESISMPVKINSRNPQDKVAKLLNQVIDFNNDYRHSHPQEKGDAISLSGGRFGLNIQSRAYFLGVELSKTQTGSFAQNLNPDGQPDIKTYDVSHGALRQVATLLRPDIPYMNNNQPMFNTQLQFITTGETLPVSIKTERDNSGRYQTTAQIMSGLILPAMNFNYLEKNADNTYKYIDNIYQQAKPLMETNPNQYEMLYQQLSQSATAQKDKLNQAQTNPFPNQQVNVAQQMTGQAQPQVDSMPFSSNDTTNVETSQPAQPVQQAQPVQSQPTQQIQQPQPQTVQNQPTQPTQPTQPVQSAQPQPTSSTDDIDKMLDSNQSLDDLLNGLN